jgi:hypothetical protein
VQVFGGGFWTPESPPRALRRRFSRPEPVARTFGSALFPPAPVPEDLR